MTANEKILDRYVRHQIYLIRYAGGLSNKAAELLKGSESRLAETILSYLKKLKGRGIASPQARAILREMAEKIAEVRGKPWRLIDELFSEELSQLAVAEAASTATIIQAAVPVILNLSLPPVEHLEKIAKSTPFEGKVLKEWAKGMQQADVDHIVSRVKVGLVQNLSIDQIAKSIIPDDTDLSDRKAARKAIRDAKSVALTVVSGISNQSRQALYAENADIIRKEYFVATLDSRTTLQCATEDGKGYARGEGSIPPLHFRCRSTRIPLIDPNNLGNRGFDPTTEKMLLKEYSQKAGLDKVTKRANLPHGHKTAFDDFARKRKRELIGQVPGKTNYATWFDRQDAMFQKEVLGATRYKMYKEGNFPLSTFVDYTGRTLTLSELRDKGLTVPDL